MSNLWTILVYILAAPLLAAAWALDLIAGLCGAPEDWFQAWLAAVRQVCWAIAHPLEAGKIIREAGEMARRIKADCATAPPERGAWLTGQSSSDHHYRATDGFTLIELLIVLAILSIVIGIIAMSASPDVRAAVWPL